MTATARKFRLTPPEPSEYETHCAIVDMLAICLQPPAMFSTFPAFGYCKLTPAQASKLARLRVLGGLPDIMLWPGDGKTLGLEIKRVGSGRLSRNRSVRSRRGGLRVIPGQVETHEQLAQVGVEVRVVRSVDEAVAAIVAFGIPLRRCSLTDA